jgi:hypothetical protein
MIDLESVHYYALGVWALGIWAAIIMLRMVFGYSK